MEKVTVKAVWEFEVDTKDFDPRFVDVNGQAKELAKRELDYLILNEEIGVSDFDFKVTDSDEDSYLSYIYKIVIEYAPVGTAITMAALINLVGINGFYALFRKKLLVPYGDDGHFLVIKK